MTDHTDEEIRTYLAAWWAAKEQLRSYSYYDARREVDDTKKRIRTYFKHIETIARDLHNQKEANNP